MQKTRSTSRSREFLAYQSTCWLDSERCAGVRYEIRRISMRGRAELARELSKVLPKLEYHLAGSSPGDQLEATQLIAAATEVYLKWGLVRLSGLTIDGKPATTETLLARGPEQLCEEVAESVKRACGLTETERKN